LLVLTAAPDELLSMASNVRTRVADVIGARVELVNS